MIRLFDPEGLKAVEYKSTYPELGETKEFESFPGKELIFVWYYANATSPLINIKDDKKRVGEALRFSGYNPDPAERETLLNRNFTERVEAAINKMGSYQPGVRYLGWKMLKNIFDQYNELVNDGVAGFTKVLKNGDSIETVLDISTWVTLSKQIAVAMPDLIKRIEEGFGVSVSGISSEEEEGSSMHREWNLNLQEK